MATCITRLTKNIGLGCCIELRCSMFIHFVNPFSHPTTILPTPASTPTILRCAPRNKELSETSESAGRNSSTSVSNVRLACAIFLVALCLIHAVQWILLVICVKRLLSYPPEARGRLVPDDDSAPCALHIKLMPVDNRFVLTLFLSIKGHINYFQVREEKRSSDRVRLLLVDTLNGPSSLMIIFYEQIWP